MEMHYKTRSPEQDKSGVILKKRYQSTGTAPKEQSRDGIVKQNMMRESECRLARSVFWSRPPLSDHLFRQEIRDDVALP